MAIAAVTKLASFGKRALKSAKKHKNGLIAGGIGGGIVATIFASIIALIPLKLQHMMENVSKKATRRIVYSIEKRSEKFIAKKLAITAIGGEAAPGKGAFYRWYANGKSDKFLKKMMDSGYEFEFRDPNGRIIKNPADWEKISPSKRKDYKLNSVSFKDPTTGSLKTISGGDLKNYSSKSLRKWVNNEVNNQIEWYRPLKRHHMKRWLKNKLGIRWKFFEAKRMKYLEAKAEIKKKIANRIIKALIKTDTFAKLINAILGEKDEGKQMANEIEKGLSEASTDEVQEKATKELMEEGGDVAKKEAVEKIEKELTEKASDKLDATARKELAETMADQSKSVLGKLLEKILGEASQKVIEAVGATAGVVTVVCLVDKVISWADGAPRVKGEIKEKAKTEYATSYAHHLNIADEIKAGHVSSEEMAVTMESLDGINNSANYDRVMYGTSGTGKKEMPDIKKPAKVFTTIAVVGKVFQVAEAVSSIFNLPVLAQVEWIVNKLCNFVSSMIGKVLTWTGITQALSGLMKITHIQDGISKLFQMLLNWIAPPVVTDATKGADLFNAVDCGGEVTQNNFFKENGGRALTKEQFTRIETLIAQEETEKLKKKGLAYRLFSPQNPKSLTSHALMDTPSSPAEGIKKLASNVFKTAIFPPYQLAKAGVALANAANAEVTVDDLNPYDLEYGNGNPDDPNADIFGLTEEDLETDPEKVDPDSNKYVGKFDDLVAKMLSEEEGEVTTTTTTGDKMDIWNANAYTADQINEYLAKNFPKSPLNGKGQAYVDAGKKYGVNPAFMLGIANAETSMGMQNQQRGNALYGTNNPCGMGCANCKHYNSWEEGIDDCTKLAGSEKFKRLKDMHEFRLKWCGYETESESPPITLSDGTIIKYPCSNGPSNWEQEVKVIMEGLARMFPSNIEGAALDVPYFSQFCYAERPKNCFPTAVAMVIKYFQRENPTISPHWVAQQGTAIELLNKYSPVPYQWHMVNNDLTVAEEALNGPIKSAIERGYPVVFSTTGQACCGVLQSSKSTVGHVLVITGFGPDGNIYLNDPNSPCKSETNSCQYDTSGNCQLVGWNGDRRTGYITTEGQSGTSLRKNVLASREAVKKCMYWYWAP